ncbi:MAG: glycosyltransferase [Lachnospiraceae bacterium]
MGQKARISQCMIVKNEEANIRQALSWGKNIMWEQIVVDTGSNDQTARIAMEMGAKVCNFPWNDDFSAAKNYAIRQAKGDWIAFLDADEYLAAGEEQKLAQIISRAGDRYDAISTGWMQLGDDGEIRLAGTQIRIFRNLPGLCYRRRIHEQLGFTEGQPMRIGDAGSEIAIFHVGYSGAVFKHKKSSKRNILLIEKELADHPGDHEMSGYMGDECYALKEFENARKWYEQSVALMPDIISEHDQRTAVTYSRLLLILSEQESCSQQERMLALYHDGIKKIPKEADFDYILGCYYAGRQDYRQGSNYFSQALKKLEQYGYTNRSMMLAANLEQAYENLLACYDHLDCFRQTVETATMLLRTYPYNFKGLCLLLKSFRQDEISKQADYTGVLLDFLKKIYGFQSLKDKLIVLKAAREVAYDGLGYRLEELISQAEWQCLSQRGIERSDQRER